MVMQPAKPDGSLRTEVLERRYLWKDKSGRVVETWDDMCRRVARVAAAVEVKHGADPSQVEALADKFYQLTVQGIFLPNSPTLMNAGRKKGMLSACFTLPIEDSITGIFSSVKNTALIQKSGGGTGFSLDRLRPTGAIVRSSGGRTSGPLSFLRVLSETTNAIQQGAFRRGANMAMMSIGHPDILRFIHAKRDLTAFTNFNFSVKVPDAFMRRLKDTPDAPHVVVNPRTGKRYVIPRSVNADSYTIDDLLPEDRAPAADCYTVRHLWDMVVEGAWATGEPGVCFIDRVNQHNPTPRLGQIEACNPCGEQPLLPYEACNLGSIDVSKFVTEGGADLDWSSLGETVRLSVRFLDYVIDANHYPVPEIRKVAIGNRKIGLGVMGFADALIMLKVCYGSEEAVQFAGKLTAFIQDHAHAAGEELANEKGCFPNWQGSIWDIEHHRPMRNATGTTMAPTGTISVLADCSSGIEPVFSFVSKRRVLDGDEFTYLHPLVERLGTAQGWLADEVRDLLTRGIPPREIPQIPKKLAEAMVIAHDVSPEWHVRIQAAFQKYTDNAVSKTVNLPSSATLDDVHKVYWLAFELGCKGITVYRDGCRNNQVIVSASTPMQQQAIRESKLRLRVRTTEGTTTKFRMGCGTLFVTVNEDQEGLCEVFSNLGRAGGCPAQSEATCRAVSVALRCGVDPEVLIEQLKGIRCLSTISRRKSGKDIEVLSCPDAIAKAIQQALGDCYAPTATSTARACPDCGYHLRHDSGCRICDNCGYDKCG